MALSFSRPDPTAPASVADAQFPTVRRGYDPVEVRDLLVRVAAELGRLHERERFLQHELRVAQEQVVDPREVLDDDTVVRLLGEETLRVLQTARESASQIRTRAEEAAARLLREASEEADRVRAAADADAARIRADATADAEAEVSLAKQQGREMVNEARAYRERVLTELARRRDAARQQIEQLASGRDRLVQAFERARLAAVDVIDGLSPLDEPDEYVNLAPTTGPVPLMLPRQAPPSPAAVESEPVVAEPEPEPEPVVVELEPEPEAAVVEPEPEPEAAAVEPEPEAAVVEPEPEPEAAVVELEPEPEAAVVELEPEPEAAVVEPEPEAAVVELEPEPEAAAVEPEPEAAAVGPEPEPEAVASAPATDRSNVVSLFARLRAETGEHPVMPTGTDLVPGPDDDRRAGAATEPGPESGPEVVAAEPEVAAEPDAVAVEEPEPYVEPDALAAEPADEAPPSMFAVRDEVLTPLVAIAARKLKRVLADEQNDVLGRLSQAEPVTELDDLVPSAAEHAGAYVAAIDAEIRAAAAAGAASCGDAEATPVSDHHLVAVAELIADGLVVPLRGRLHRGVTDDAGANDEIGRTIRAVYREWKVTHIDALLDDVLRLAHGIGVLAAAAPGRPMCWNVDPAGPACPDAEDNALGGAVPAGEPYPTGHRTAPAHPGCRCLIAPTGN